MNTQTTKNLKSGFMSAVLAAVIGTVMLAIITRLAGGSVTLEHLALSGLMIGLATFILAFLIGGVIQLTKTSK